MSISTLQVLPTALKGTLALRQLAQALAEANLNAHERAVVYQAFRYVVLKDNNCIGPVRRWPFRMNTTDAEPSSSLATLTGGGKAANGGRSSTRKTMPKRYCNTFTADAQIR